MAEGRTEATLLARPALLREGPGPSRLGAIFRTGPSKSPPHPHNLSHSPVARVTSRGAGRVQARRSFGRGHRGLPLNPGVPQHFLPFQRRLPSCTQLTAALLYNQLTAVLHRFSILIASLCERRRAPVNGEAAVRLESRRGGGDTRKGLKGSQCAPGRLLLFFLKKRIPQPLSPRPSFCLSYWSPESAGCPQPWEACHPLPPLTRASQPAPDPVP